MEINSQEIHLKNLSSKFINETLYITETGWCDIAIKIKSKKKSFLYGKTHIFPI